MRIKSFSSSIAATNLYALDIKKKHNLVIYSEGADSYPFSSWIKYFSEPFMKAVHLEYEFKCVDHLI